MKMMPRLQRKSSGWTRRQILAGTLVGAACAEQSVWPSERVRFLDAATELEIWRLTDPAHESILPPPQNRVFSRRGGAWFAYSSDRTGKLEPYLMNLESWQSRALAPVEELDPASLCFTPDARNVCAVGGDTLYLLPAGGGAGRAVYRLKGAASGRGLNTVSDGPSALVVEEGRRLKMVNLARGTASTLAENEEGVCDPLPRPRRAAAVYRTEKGVLWLAEFGGRRNYPLPTVPGRAASACWSPDGRALLYLHYPGAGPASAIRELVPDSGEDRLVAPTSQFAQFSPNGDASVFVGSSSQRAGPYVFLLLRSVKRELALCEHRASQPERVSAMFTPDSQRILYQTDRQGKMVIYAAPVERLVEKTAGETGGGADRG